MKNIPLPSAKTSPAISVSELERYVEGWTLCCEINQHSAATLAKRKIMVSKLLWFLRYKEYQECGLNELRAFFAYLSDKKPIPGGRWGIPRENQPVKPSTVQTYHATIRTLFRWIVEEDGLDSSPVERIPVPTDRADQITPFSPEQIDALTTAARRGRNPKRDEAILLFLLDSGVRASELCNLCFKDVDMTARRACVEGKGGKTRSTYFGKTTAKALWNYLKREGGREPEDAVFQSERGDALTRSGLQQLIERWGKAANITTARCSPHTFRHTAGVQFIKAGGSQFALMEMLGHTDLKMTARYVKLAQADVQNQHNRFSPVETMKKGQRK